MEPFLARCYGCFLHSNFDSIWREEGTETKDKCRTYLVHSWQRSPRWDQLYESASSGWKGMQLFIRHSRLCSCAKTCRLL